MSLLLSLLLGVVISRLATTLLSLVLPKHLLQVESLLDVVIECHDILCSFVLQKGRDLLESFGIDEVPKHWLEKCVIYNRIEVLYFLMKTSFSSSVHTMAALRSRSRAKLSSTKLFVSTYLQALTLGSNINGGISATA